MQLLDCEFQGISFQDRNPALGRSVKAYPLRREGLPHDEMCESPSDTVHKDIYSALWVCLFDLLIGQLEFILETIPDFFH